MGRKIDLDKRKKQRKILYKYSDFHIPFLLIFNKFSIPNYFSKNNWKKPIFPLYFRFSCSSSKRPSFQRTILTSNILKALSSRNSSKHTHPNPHPPERRRKRIRERRACLQSWWWRMKYCRRRRRSSSGEWGVFRKWIGRTFWYLFAKTDPEWALRWKRNKMCVCVILWIITNSLFILPIAVRRVKKINKNK